MSAEREAEPRPPVSQAGRIFSILEACAGAGRPLTLPELAAATGLPKSSLHRTCAALADLGALEAADGGYLIGTRLFALGALNPRLRRLRLVSMPYLHELVASSGWVANLAVLSGQSALLVDEVFDVRPRLPKQVGALLPLHATAIGKALLAGQPPARREELLASLPLRPFTRNTVVRREALREQAAAIAAEGVAVSREEWRLGTSAVAAPVRAGGEALGAVALIGPAGERGLSRLVPVVRAAARDLEAALAGERPGERAEAFPGPAVAL